MRRITALCLLFALLVSGCVLRQGPESPPSSDASFIASPADAPAYSGSPYVAIRDNVPELNAAEYTRLGYEYYAPLDLLGRCGETEALIGPETMPTEERGNIGQVKPSGWQLAKYDFVDGKYLYNRCHLIGFQLAGENANEQNLITGTRYMNVTGMLPFENLVADYVRETGNHVIYRVVPIFRGAELVARGVHMQALSVEDSGEAISFNVFVYNVQPGVEIDYATGESYAALTPTPGNAETVRYILNTSSKKFHLPSCAGAASIKAENRENSADTRQTLIDRGYDPCGTCKP
ncbi:MAG: DNA/RNA non-specific endonuclease [Clostridia bacterium]|nr:DNA/RNA non-specific endonuclease [Clostridia bacterium]